MAEHTHDYGWPRATGSIRMCSGAGCTAMAVMRPLGQTRELTASEQVDVFALMWEDLIVADALQIVHGKHRGLRRARYLLGGIPESTPLPDSLNPDDHKITLQSQIGMRRG